MAMRWRRVHGNARSQAAQEAEAAGEMPLTRAVAAVYAALECKKRRIPRRRVRKFLEANCGCGWHHVAGPNDVRRVDYYATLLTEDQKRDLLGDDNQTRLCR